VSPATGALVYDIVDSPLGDVLVAASDAGVVRVSIGDRSAEAALEELDGSPLGPPVRNRRALGGPTSEVRQYFAGTRKRFSSPVDLSVVRGFARSVLEATARIPYGDLATYGDVAAKAGRERAARAAGNALRGNPVMLLVPCHRVVPASGGIGGYGGQEAHKAFLLDLESGVGGRGHLRPESPGARR
jgi:methylated-DNA-[protein]-cysteine S-methyltransferase